MPPGTGNFARLARRPDQTATPNWHCRSTPLAHPSAGWRGAVLSLLGGLLACPSLGSQLGEQLAELVRERVLAAR